MCSKDSGTDDSEENGDYDDDDEAEDGPFQMITETNFADEDYYDL